MILGTVFLRIKELTLERIKRNIFIAFFFKISYYLMWICSQYSRLIEHYSSNQSGLEYAKIKPWKGWTDYDDEAMVLEIYVVWNNSS